MSTLFKRSFINLAVVTALVSATPVMSQSTSSGIVGQIQDNSGSSITNATITIVHAPSNSTSVITSNSNGRFNAKGLRVGGPYVITVNSPEGNRIIEDVYLTLGENFELDIKVGVENLEEVFVVGNYQEQSFATGPSSAFSLEDLQNAPAINRDLKDVLRLDPRVYIDEAFEDSIQCAGANPRFNSLTVDGVRMNDNFGLNSNGYPTERMPFPFDAIDQVAIELAPFDVQYGGFSACNVNAVTKSGGNEFGGSFFYDYTNDSLSGDSLEGDDIDRGSFNEKRFGLTFGGPIIEDKLFFFIAAEKLEGVDTFDRGPVGASVGREIEGVSQAQFNEIVRISNELYNYDPGGLPASIPVEDEKLLLKLDWNISDAHRASFTYNYNDGFTIAESDGDSNELELSNHYYTRQSKLTNYVVQVFSEWTDIFSSEVKIGYSELDNSQTPIGGTEFGEVQITTLNDHDGDGNDSRATVYLGADDSRHANKLDYDSLNIKAAGTLLLGNNTVTFGFERETFDVFNLFIQEAEGEYRFNSVEDFEAGTPSRITYENAAFTNVKNDAAATFEYTTNTAYVQDEIAFDDLDLTLVVGLRYDWYETSDEPALNQGFTDVYGFSNQATIDGIDLLQPRLGFDWQLNDDLEIHGGIGLYSGGNPNVWLSNNYSNDGVTQIEVQDRSGTSVFDLPFNGSGRPIYDIPQELFDAVAAGTGSQGGVNLLDPDFELPSSWKYAIGASLVLPNDVVLTGDFLYSESQDAAIVSDISRVASGTAPDGRTIYSGPNGRSQDFMLTNVDGDSGTSKVFSIGISKVFESGFDVALGYAYTDAEDVNPMTSSVAFSNYTNIATSDPENPGVATSNYEIPYRFTLKMGYTKAFFGDYETKFTVFGSANEGRPYSYVFDDGFKFGDSTGFISRHLLYVPDGLSDPNAVFADSFDTDAFFAWANSEGLSQGKIIERNQVQSDWWTKFDIKIEQELPGFMSEHRSSIFFVIENFGNFLNDDWGVQYETSFPRAQAAVEASINDNGQYVFEEFLDPTGQTRVSDSSLWEMRFGLKYTF